jgi:F0F1-type ATP synthase assembly protein I
MKKYKEIAKEVKAYHEREKLKELYEKLDKAKKTEEKVKKKMNILSGLILLAIIGILITLYFLIKNFS